MRPGIYNTEFWRGNTETLKFELLDDNDQPIDLTGSVVKMYVLYDGVTINKTGVIDNPTDGSIIFTFTADDTRAMTSIAHAPKYEVERVVGTTQTTIVAGQIVLKGGITSD